MTAPIPPPDPGARTKLSGEYFDRARRRLRLITEDAALQPPLFARLEMHDAAPNVEADLYVRWRCDPRLVSPDECEAAILQLLFVRGLTRHNQIVEMLEADGFPASTIKRRIAKLAGRGLILCGKDAPHGYNLCPQLRARAESYAG